MIPTSVINYDGLSTMLWHLTSCQYMWIIPYISLKQTCLYAENWSKLIRVHRGCTPVVWHPPDLIRLRKFQSLYVLTESGTLTPKPGTDFTKQHYNLMIFCHFGIIYMWNLILVWELTCCCLLTLYGAVFFVILIGSWVIILVTFY